MVRSMDRRTRWGWLLLGFALGGFFDGILLHQILQWHHLLSGLDGAAGDLRFQILADGLFHLMMYVVALVGAVMLVSARAAGAPIPATSGILRLALIGFGSWHVSDAVPSHWLLGLHRIRMDSDMPLAWDVAWLVIFGVATILLAMLLPSGGRGSRSSSAAVASIVVGAGLAAGVGSMGRDAETLVVFRAGVQPADMMRAVQIAGAQLRWTDASGTVWALDGLSASGVASLYKNGALMVGSTPALAGCLAFTRRV